MSVADLFFFLSGEHENLPASELKAILETEGYTYEVSEKIDQVLRLKADLSCASIVTQKAAFTRLCGIELFNCKAETSDIIKAIGSTNLDQVLKENETFVVRVKHVKDCAPNINGMILERKLGEIILNRVAKTSVKLKKPDKMLIGILTNDRFIFGVKLAEIRSRPFVDRRPRKKPFFHPSAMPAKLARCMANLAEPKKGELVLDPFCGTGGMLIEAAYIGSRVLGLDVQRRMARGTLRNLAFFNVDPEGVIIGDARDLPITSVDCVVTDPPYGKSATTMKRRIGQVVAEVLKSVHELLQKRHRVCMAAPKELNIVSIGSALGYKHLESHFVYVHRSLTREIVVFEKV